MLNRLLENVEIVRIVAPSEQDAFRLFETLNDRGLALSAADLIKNKLFSACGDDVDEAFEAWTQLQTTLKDENVVDYLRYWWIANHDFARTRGLYSVYKKYIDSLDNHRAGIMALDLAEHANDYAEIVRPDMRSPRWGKDVAEVLEKLNIFRARICRPILIACSTNKKRASQLLAAAQICEAITVRYSVIGEKPSNNLEKYYARVCSNLRNPKVESLKDAFESDFLHEVPDDKELITKLATMEVRTSLPPWRKILSEVYRYKGTGEIAGSDKVHIEHILPQKPTPKALRECEFKDKDEASDYTNRLGNLTLLCGRKNIKASNKPPSEKTKYYRESDIRINQKLAETGWNRKYIDERSQQLAEEIATVFPHPRTYWESKPS